MNKRLEYYKKLREEGLKLYQSGMTQKAVSEMLNVDRRTIERWCKKAGISRHHGPQSLTKREDFFDVIDTEEKAYFLGFIMADGNVSTHYNQWALKLGVSYKDKYIIDKFCDAVQTKIVKMERITTGKYGDKRKLYSISLTSKHMIQSLMNAGVMPNKSGKEVFSKSVPENLKHHFVRGYFDGDGYISPTKAYMNLCGGLDILTNFNHIFNDICAIRKIKGTYCLTKSTKQFISDLYYYLYKDATVYLIRKYNSFLSHGFKKIAKELPF